MKYFKFFFRFDQENYLHDLV